MHTNTHTQNPRTHTYTHMHAQIHTDMHTYAHTCVCIHRHEYTHICTCVLHAKSLQSCLTLATPWAVAHQTPLSMGFSRQESWRGWPFPPPGGLPAPGIKPASLMSPAWAGGVFTSRSTWEAPYKRTHICITHTHTYTHTNTHTPESMVGRPGHRSCCWI